MAPQPQVIASYLFRQWTRATLPSYWGFLARSVAPWSQRPFRSKRLGRQGFMDLQLECDSVEISRVQTRRV